MIKGEFMKQSKKTIYYLIWLVIAFILYIEMYVSLRSQLEYGARMLPRAIALMSPFIFIEGLLFFTLRALTAKDDQKKRKIFFRLGLFFTIGAIIAIFLYAAMLGNM